MPEPITVFHAKRIITMDPGRPTADAVAVRDGRIVSVGSRASMQQWLDMIRRQGPLDVGAMAVCLGVSATGVRPRLVRLVDAGLV